MQDKSNFINKHKDMGESAAGATMRATGTCRRHPPVGQNVSFFAAVRTRGGGSREAAYGTLHPVGRRHRESRAQGEDGGSSRTGVAKVISTCTADGRNPKTAIPQKDPAQTIAATLINSAAAARSPFSEGGQGSFWIRYPVARLKPAFAAVASVECVFLLFMKVLTS